MINTPKIFLEVERKAELFPLPGQFAGLPRGSISEIIGDRSSGSTALVHAILAESTGRGEICALVDWANTFDPATALRNGVILGNLLWVRCDRQPDIALKVADQILHTGGFGGVVLDLYSVAPNVLRRIPLSWWYRFRKAIEHTSTILAITSNQPVTGSCASCVIQLQHRETLWSGSARTPMLSGIDLQSTSKKPVHGVPVLQRVSMVE